MSWITPVLESLAEQPCCGYEADGPAGAEPTALAALALLGHGQPSAAQPALDYLVQLQSPEGSVGIRAGHDTPRWPTTLAVLAWRAGEAMADVPADPARHRAVPQGVRWLLSVRGEILEKAPYLGHDTRLSAWPWVEGTHSWVEPSALSLVALKAVGLADHPRAREAARLLIDRQLGSGGCNCGNTVVLGRQLRPQVQPTGMAMLALAGEPDDDRKIERSLQYLERNLSPRTTIASLAWGILGLAAHGRAPRHADAWLEQALQRADRSSRSPYKQALAALAALQEHSPLAPTAVSDAAAAPAD